MAGGPGRGLVQCRTAIISCSQPGQQSASWTAAMACDNRCGRRQAPGTSTLTRAPCGWRRRTPTSHFQALVDLFSLHRDCPQDSVLTPLSRLFPRCGFTNATDCLLAGPESSPGPKREQSLDPLPQRPAAFMVLGCQLRPRPCRTSV